MTSTLKGRENVYTCQKCRKTVTTIDRDEGVTPFMIGHEQVGSTCTGDMYSSFYPEGPRPPHISPPSYEWYRPEKDAIAQLSDGERHHVEQGGLLLRPITAA